MNYKTTTTAAYEQANVTELQRLAKEYIELRNPCSILEPVYHLLNEGRDEDIWQDEAYSMKLTLLQLLAFMAEPEIAKQFHKKYGAGNLGLQLYKLVEFFDTIHDDIFQDQIEAYEIDQYQILENWIPGRIASYKKRIAELKEKRANR